MRALAAVGRCRGQGVWAVSPPLGHPVDGVAGPWQCRLLRHLVLGASLGGLHVWEVGEGEVCPGLALLLPCGVGAAAVGGGAGLGVARCRRLQGRKTHRVGAGLG